MCTFVSRVCVCVCATVAALLIDAPWLGCVAHGKRKSVLLFFDVSPSSLLLSPSFAFAGRETSPFPFLLYLRLLFHPSPSVLLSPPSVSVPPRVSSLPNPRLSALSPSLASWPVGSPCPGHRCNEEQACAPLKTCFEVWNTLS